MKKLKRHVIFLIRRLFFFKIKRHIIVLYDIYFSYMTYACHWIFYYISFICLNNICILGLHIIYVTLFSSVIYMLVIYSFCVTQNTYICNCSPWSTLFKKSQNMHTFFFVSAVRLEPCDQLTRVITWFKVSQWDHTSYDDDCFYYHSWRNNVVLAFGTLSSFLT